MKSLQFGVWSLQLRVWEWCKRNKGKILFFIWALPMIHYGATKKTVIVVTPLGDGRYSTQVLKIEDGNGEMGTGNGEKENENNDNP